jgi:nucleolar protein 14
MVKHAAAAVGGARKSKAGAASAVPNPFDMRTTRLKHDVMGKRVKGKIGHATQSRTKAMKERETALKQELQNRDKSNSFLDKRLGETDRNLDPEDKSLARFKAERMSQMLAKRKSNRFNLGADGEDVVLTHKGRTLGDDVELSDSGFSSDQDAGTQRHNHDMTSKFNFGGDGVDEADRPKRSKKEVMEEVIAKSKAHKLERQREKQNADELLDTIDYKFQDVTEFLSKRSREEKAREDAENNQDEFNVVANELRYEARMQAADRLMSEEELAKSEKNRLLSLEQARISRMHQDQENEDDAGAIVTKASASRTQQFRQTFGGGDDLDENFVLGDDEEEGSADGSDEEEDGQDDDEEEGDNEEGEGEEEEEEEGSSDESSLGDDDIADIAAEEAAELADSDSEDEARAPQRKSASSSAPQLLPKKKLSASDKTAAADAEADAHIPFVFELPASIEQLKALLTEFVRSDATAERTQRLVLQRLLSCHHVQLGGENKKLMEKLYDIMLELLAVVAAEGDVVLCNSLTIGLWAAAQQVPVFAAAAARARIEVLLNEFRDTSMSSDVSACYPDMKVLSFFMATSAIFPVTDRRHNVTTPAALYLCQLCSSFAVQPLDSPFVALSALCTLAVLLDYYEPAKRFAGEIYGLLNSVLASVLPSVGGETAYLSAALQSKAACDMPSFFALNAGHACVLSEGQIVGVFAAFLKMALRAIKLAHGCSGTPQALCGILNAAEQLKKAATNATIKQLAGDVHEAAAAAVQLGQAGRLPLANFKAKPVPMRQFNPMFNDDFDPSRNSDPDKERAAVRRIAKQHNQELKKVSRDLRKDSGARECRDVQRRALCLTNGCSVFAGASGKEVHEGAPAQGEQDKGSHDAAVRVPLGLFPSPGILFHFHIPLFPSAYFSILISFRAATASRRRPTKTRG